MNMTASATSALLSSQHKLGRLAVQGLEQTLNARLSAPNANRGASISKFLHEGLAQALNQRMQRIPTLRENSQAFSDVSREGVKLNSFDGEQKSADLVIQHNGRPAIAYFDKMPGQNILQNRGNYISDLHSMAALTEHNPGLMVSMCFLMPAVAPHFNVHGDVTGWERPDALIGGQRLQSLVATAQRNGGDFQWHQIPYHLNDELQSATTKTGYQAIAKRLIQNGQSVLDETHRATLELRVAAMLLSMVQHLKDQEGVSTPALASRSYVPGFKRSTLRIA